MLGDVFTKVSNAQSMAGTEPILSTDSIDMLANKDVGPGTRLRMIFHVTTTIVMNASSASLQFQIINCDDDAGANPVVIGMSDFIAKATLTAGRAPVVVETNQQWGLVGKRFIKARYVANDGADMTSGNVTAQYVPLTDSGDGGKTYPSGFPTP